MSPEYDIKCLRCGFERELKVSHWSRCKPIMNILKCDKCEEISWKKMPTAANVYFKGNGFTKKFHT